MGHDDVEQARSPGFPIFVVKRDQTIGSQRHNFPPDQKEESIGGSKNDRQAEKQEME